MQDVARLLFVRVHIGRGQDPCISAGAAHAKDANGQWSRRCEDGVAQAHDADGQWNRRCEDGGTRKRCEDGGVRRIIGSKQGRTIWGSMDTVAWSMMDAAAVGSPAGP